MSYRNPQQFVDKQSGQAYVDLIKTSIGVGDAMAKRAREKAKANEKENLRLIREREQGVLNLRTEFAKRSGDNFNADDWEPMVQRYDIIQQKIDNGTATAQEKQEQAKILASPYTAKSLGENLLSNAEELTSSVANVGKPGGFDAKGSSPEGLKNAQIFLGQLAGANNLTFVDGEAAFDINGKVHTESSVREFLNRDLGANVLGRIIPDEGPNFQAAHEFSLMPDPGGSTDPKKRVINPAYLTEIEKREEKNGDITYYRTPNFDLLRQPGNPVGAELRANAESLLEMPGNSAVSMWNNTLDNKGTDWDYENVLTDDQKKQFVEAYVDYGLGANYFTQEIIERTEKAPKPKELTATERKQTEKLKISKQQLDSIKNFPMEINVEDVSVIGNKGTKDKFELINKLSQNMVKDISGKGLKLRQIEGGDVEFLLGSTSMGTASIKDMTSEDVKKFVYKIYGGSPKEIGGFDGKVLPSLPSNPLLNN
tara:strand:- start:160 stop:1605 length:1446 start_codon:yes stop_codon:yes gene_type:complete